MHGIFFVTYGLRTFSCLLYDAMLALNYWFDKSTGTIAWCQVTIVWQIPLIAAWKSSLHVRLSHCLHVILPPCQTVILAPCNTGKMLPLPDLEFGKHFTRAAAFGKDFTYKYSMNHIFSWGRRKNCCPPWIPKSFSKHNLILVFPPILHSFKYFIKKSRTLH